MIGIDEAINKNVVMATQALDENDEHHFVQACQNLADLNGNSPKHYMFIVAKGLRENSKIFSKTLNQLLIR